MKVTNNKQLPLEAINDYIELIMRVDRPNNAQEAANEALQFMKVIIYKNFKL